MALAFSNTLPLNIFISLFLKKKVIISKTNFIMHCCYTFISTLTGFFFVLLVCFVFFFFILDGERKSDSPEISMLSK